jgi:hypothetical protein
VPLAQNSTVIGTAFTAGRSTSIAGTSGVVIVHVVAAQLIGFVFGCLYILYNEGPAKNCT